MQRKNYQTKQALITDKQVQTWCHNQFNECYEFIVLHYLGKGHSESVITEALHEVYLALLKMSFDKIEKIETPYGYIKSAVFRAINNQKKLNSKYVELESDYDLAEYVDCNDDSLLEVDADMPEILKAISDACNIEDKDLKIIEMRSANKSYKEIQSVIAKMSSNKEINIPTIRKRYSDLKEKINQNQAEIRKKLG